VVERIMASQLKKTIRHCRECLAFRDSGPDGAHCAMNNKTFGTHPVDKDTPGWCMLRRMAVVLEYKGR